MLGFFLNQCMIRDNLIFFFTIILTMFFAVYENKILKLLELSLLAFSFYKQYIYLMVYCKKNDYLLKIRNILGKVLIAVLSHYMIEIAKTVV